DENRKDCDENRKDCDENRKDCDENRKDCDENRKDCDENREDCDENRKDCDQNSTIPPTKIETTTSLSRKNRTSAFAATENRLATTAIMETTGNRTSAFARTPMIPELQLRDHAFKSLSFSPSGAPPQAAHLKGKRWCVRNRTRLLRTGLKSLRLLAQAHDPFIYRRMRFKGLMSYTFMIRSYNLAWGFRGDVIHVYDPFIQHRRLD
ncbi:hypothetical protein KKF97_19180, partial [Myxococcota bacterium]|nr:hypothetical protein [Myxococcota bacterium]